MRFNEKGFTVIELLIGVAIVGFITPIIAMTIMGLLTNQQQATDHNVVLHQVQNAGYWISRDVQMAESVTLSDPNGFPLTLDIPTDIDENNDYSVTYLFDGNKLKREVYDSEATLISERFVAEYVDIQSTTFSSADINTYTFTIRVSKGEVAQGKSYEVSQRLGSG